MPANITFIIGMSFIGNVFILKVRLLRCYSWVDGRNLVYTIPEECVCYHSQCVLLFRFVPFSQAKVNIIAGCCMAMGLRFAGSANQEAFNCLVCYWFSIFF